MFDVGFMELMLIGVVALLVVGPERLPGLARTAGKWVGKMRSFVSNVKTDIDKELKAEELKQILEKQKEMANPLESFVEDTKETVGKVQEEVEKVESSINTSLHKND